jgi:hypothetical protein
VWLDLLLGQVEREAGLPPGQTGIEAQIEDAGVQDGPSHDGGGRDDSRP